MTPKTGKLLLMLLASGTAIYFLFFFRLDALGLVSTDEPRYAAIGREMAQSGDWITPRLWGTPWFEKPALLYWMTGLATLGGFGTELAPRFPVALLSAAFVVFFFVVLRREWGWQPAFFSTAVLASSAGWVAYSQIGVPDLPLAVLFNTAVLVALPWVTNGERRMLPLAAAFLGLAVLAKGLVALVLVLPIFWFARKHFTDLLHPLVLGAFAATALPWYALCTARNGLPFLQTFFLQHQLGRFTSGELQHVQPFWFYAPVLLGCLFPWTALLPLIFQRALYSNVTTRFFAAIAAWGVTFFSLSTNKLPGYLLPLLPPTTALIGLSLSRVRFAAPWLLMPALTLAWVPVAGAMLPIALVSGVRKAWPVEQIVKFRAALLMLPLMLSGGLALLAERLARRHWAMAGIFAATVLSVIWLKVATLPEVDRLASARGTYRNASKNAAICVGPMPRAWHYGLNYYFKRLVPDCQPGQSALPLAPAP